MSEESATVVQASAVPSDIYVGTNVVHRHIFEFFDLAANQLLLGEGEQVLAIFDCIILDNTGRRLGGLTLHDYAVLTDKNLITWGRGRSKDIVDKFGWNDVALDKFGRRTPIEGVIKVLYKSRPINRKKRRISVRANNEATVSNPDDKIRPATETGGVSLYLDLMPAGDVRPCVEMMRYLMGVSEGVPSVDGFRARFRDQILSSQRSLAEVALVLQPFYVDAGNGIMIEADADEERVYQSVPRHITARAERIQPASPYRNSGGSTRRGVNSPYRGSSSQGRSNRIQAAPAPATNVSVGMNIVEPPAGSSSLNKGNRRTSTGAPGKDFGESGLPSTVSLANQGYSGPSKLESYEKRATGGSRLDSTTTPAPARRATTPAPRSEPTPVARPVPPVPTQRTERVRPAVPTSEGRSRQLTPPVVDRLVPEQANYDRPLSMPIGVAIPKLVLNVYNVSRLTRGLWLQPQNLIRNVTDLSETVGVLGDVTNLIATDAETRRIAINRLKYAVDRGPLARNLILHYTIWPFIKPVVDLIALPGSYEAAQTYNRVRVRGGNNIDDAVEDIVGDTDLPDMGVVAGNDNVTSSVPVAAKPVPMPRVTPSTPVPPTPMPRVTPSTPVPPTPMPKVNPSNVPPTQRVNITTNESPGKNIEAKVEPKAEPIPVKRQPIGDLEMGGVSFNDRSALKNERASQGEVNQTPPVPVPPQAPPSSKLGNDFEVSSKDLQDDTPSIKGETNPPPSAKSKLGEDF